MNRVFCVISLAALLALTGIGQGGPVTPYETQVIVVQPMFSSVNTVEFKGGQRACALALGDGASYLGLYVYDIYGNCVAWDDEGALKTRDDLAAQWYPLENAPYVIEVRNCGLQPNRCKIVLR